MGADGAAAQKAWAHRVEELLGDSAWVIDLLPRQVPADGGGQFFAVEERLLAGENGADLRRRFAEVLLKLNCYFDLVVFRGGRGHATLNPSPRKLERWVCRGEEGLTILLPSEDALVVVQTESTGMALHHPDPALLELVGALAGASGLFVWKPGE